MTFGQSWNQHYQPSLEMFFRLFVILEQPLQPAFSSAAGEQLTKPVVVCPLGKLDLGNPHGFDPIAPFHDCRCNSQASSASGLLR